ncbi:MAG: ribonuclease HII [Alkalinema sp. FL-bin-369]|nr:ribonuclease HII [Leptolyngbyaceae cyanobacterium LF-bin-369]
MVTFPTLEFEAELWRQGLFQVAGVDEVGLGCLAGPIVAAAVVISAEVQTISLVRDSKALSAKQRDQVFEHLSSQGLPIGIGMASVSEIEQVNVLQASYLAMRRAISRVQPIDHALIDGRPIKVELGVPITTLIKGDARSYAIACASIVAKVRRDRLMVHLAKRYPGYGWERNMGYGTPQHLQGIQSIGITPWHRTTYAPVRLALLEASKKSL